MVRLELWLGLTVRYRLPRRQRIEGPSIGFVRDLLLDGSLRFDHLLFTFSPRGALVIRPNQMGACSAASPAGVSLISDLWPPPRRSIHPKSASRLRAPAVAAIGSLATIFQSPALRYCMTCRWLARTRRSAFWLIISPSPSARARQAGGWHLNASYRSLMPTHQPRPRLTKVFEMKPWRRGR